METESGNRMKDIHEDFSRGSNAINDIPSDLIPGKSFNNAIEDIVFPLQGRSLSDRAKKILKNYNTYCKNCSPETKEKCTSRLYYLLRLFDELEAPNKKNPYCKECPAQTGEDCAGRMYNSLTKVGAVDDRCTLEERGLLNFNKQN